MSENEFQSGDRVIIDPEYVTKSLRGRVFEVVRRMKVNYELRPLDGVGRNLAAHPGEIVPAPKELLAKPIVAVTPFELGSTVRVKAANIDPSTLFVVLSNGSKVKVAKLGNDESRYWNVPRTWLEKVTIDLVAAAASAQAAEV